VGAGVAVGTRVGSGLAVAVGRITAFWVADGMGGLVATGSTIGCATRAKSQAVAENKSITHKRINFVFKHLLLIP